MHILCASPALNCLVCTKAGVIFTAVSGVELCSTGRILFCILHARSKQSSEGSGTCTGDGEGRKTMRFSLQKLLGFWMSEIGRGFKNISETNSSGENALLKCIFSKGCGSEVCCSVLFPPFLSSYCILMTSVWAVALLTDCGHVPGVPSCSSEGQAQLSGYAAPEQLYTNSFSFELSVFYFWYHGEFLRAGGVCVFWGVVFC